MSFTPLPPTRYPGRPARETVNVLQRAKRGTYVIPASVQNSERCRIAAILEYLTRKGFLSKSEQGLGGHLGHPSKYDITEVGLAALDFLGKDPRLKTP